MNEPSASIRELARRLLAIEAEHPDGDASVVETLRVSLTRFAGQDGVRALMRRAVVVARAEVSVLDAVTVGDDGSIEGIDETAEGANEAAAAVTAHLLWLLVTFIGEAMTLRLVREEWPDI